MWSGARAGAIGRKSGARQWRRKKDRGTPTYGLDVSVLRKSCQLDSDAPCSASWIFSSLIRKMMNARLGLDVLPFCSLNFSYSTTQSSVAVMPDCAPHVSAPSPAHEPRW